MRTTSDHRAMACVRSPSRRAASAAMSAMRALAVGSVSSSTRCSKATRAPLASPSRSLQRAPSRRASPASSPLACACKYASKPRGALPPLSMKHAQVRHEEHRLHGPLRPGKATRDVFVSAHRLLVVIRAGQRARGVNCVLRGVRSSGARALGERLRRLQPASACLVERRAARARAPARSARPLPALLRRDPRREARRPCVWRRPGLVRGP